MSSLADPVVAAGGGFGQRRLRFAGEVDQQQSWAIPNASLVGILGPRSPQGLKMVQVDR
jgi:hypothetical protein